MSSIKKPTQSTEQTLQEWFQSHGGILQSVCIVHQGRERQMLTQQAIAAGDYILKIPFSVLLCEQLLHHDTNEEHQLIIQLGHCMSRQARLAALFLLEAESKHSKWQPYIRSLPHHLDHIPLFLDQPTSRMLAGSSVHESILERRFMLNLDYQQLTQKISGFSRFSMSNFAWARTLVNTRCFCYQNDGEQQVAMVPLLDMCQHSDEPNAFWYFDDTSREFLLTANTPIAANKEVVVSYGKKHNSRLFSSYGFYLPGSGLDQAVLTASLSPQDKYFQQKHALVGKTQGNWSLSNYYDDAMKSLMSFLRLNALDTLNATELTLWETQNALSLNNELHALSQLDRLSQQALKGFPTTIKQDLDILAQSDLNANQRACIEITLKEKQVLSNIGDFAKLAMSFLLGQDKRSSKQAENTYFKGYLIELQRLNTAQSEINLYVH